LPALKSASSSTAKSATPADARNHSLLSFVPPGIARSIAEYGLAAIAGAVLLFAFFMLAEIASVIFKSEIISMVFLPVICVMPVISGAVSALLLEKIRNRSASLKSGALVGMVSGLVGAAIFSLVLFGLELLAQLHPFGNFFAGAIILAALVPIMLIDGVLGALGGALVAKFAPKETQEA